MTLTTKQKATQKERVLKYLQQHGSITIIEAWRELGVFSLSSRISRLRLDDGINITKAPHKIKNRFGESITITRYTYHVREPS